MKRFLLSKLSGIFTAIMIVLCIVAIGISARVSTSAANRKAGIGGALDISSTDSDSTLTGKKVINPAKLEERQLYINGLKKEGFSSYYADEKFYIPLGVIIERINCEVEYYQSDDIICLKAEGSNIIIRMGQKLITVDGEDVELPASPISGKNDILVPPEFLNYIRSFSYKCVKNPGAVFINTQDGYDKLENIDLRFLRISNKKANISDREGKIVFWESNEIDLKEKSIQKSYNGNNILLKSGNISYIISKNFDETPLSIYMDSTATISDDGKFLYWIDRDKKTSYIYSIEDRQISELGDYYTRINTSELVNGGRVLSEYVNANGIMKLILTNEIHKGSYVFFEEEGNTIAEGFALPSPDNSKGILFGKDNVKYLIDYNDMSVRLLTGVQHGTQQDYVKWINNHRILAGSGNKMRILYISPLSEENVVETESEWNMTGKAEGGQVFYTVDNVLWVENEGAEAAIIDLPWTCSYAYADVPEGPYILASSKEDGIFLLKDGVITKIGKHSSILHKMEQGNAVADYERSISFTPDKRNFMIIQTEEGFVSLNFIKTDGTGMKKVFINCHAKQSKCTDFFEYKWVSDSMLVVYTHTQGWIIDIEGEEPVIYTWKEEKGSRIEAMLFGD